MEMKPTRMVIEWDIVKIVFFRFFSPRCPPMTLSNVDMLMRRVMMSPDFEVPENFGTNPDAPDSIVEGFPF